MSNARPYARDANTNTNQDIHNSTPPPQELKLAAAGSIFSCEEFRYSQVKRYFPLIPTSFLVSLVGFRIRNGPTHPHPCIFHGHHLSPFRSLSRNPPGDMLIRFWAAGTQQTVWTVIPPWLGPLGDNPSDFRGDFMTQVQAQPGSCFLKRNEGNTRNLPGFNLPHRSSQPQQNDCSHKHGRDMGQTASI